LELQNYRQVLGKFKLLFDYYNFVDLNPPPFDLVSQMAHCVTTPINEFILHQLTPIKEQSKQVKIKKKYNNIDYFIVLFCNCIWFFILVA
jgi:hypothetical protein